MKNVLGVCDQRDGTRDFSTANKGLHAFVNRTHIGDRWLRHVRRIARGTGAS